MSRRLIENKRQLNIFKINRSAENGRGYFNLKMSDTREKLLAGYNKMMKVIQPKQVLLFGKNPGGLDGDIVEMGYEMQDAFRLRVNKEDN